VSTCCDCEDRAWSMRDGSSWSIGSWRSIGHQGGSIGRHDLLVEAGPGLAHEAQAVGLLKSCLGLADFSQAIFEL
jgi:uncharacterized membrane protein